MLYAAAAAGARGKVYVTFLVIFPEPPRPNEGQSFDRFLFKHKKAVGGVGWGGESGVVVLVVLTPIYRNTCLTIFLLLLFSKRECSSKWVNVNVGARYMQR